MDKESGVYLTITDNSFQTSGATVLKPIVAMLATKGKMGLNYVTADTFKDVLGYDLKYNSNYYGLSKILEDVSYAYVWRLNQNAKMANAYFLSATDEKQSSVDCETFEDITEMDPTPLLAVANKDLGNPQTTAVKITPAADETIMTNENPTASTPQTIVLEDVSENEKETFDSQEILSGCKFYNSTNDTTVGVIKKNINDELKVYKVSDGEIVDDEVKTLTSNIWSDGTNFYNSQIQISTEPEGEAGEPVELGNIRESDYDLTHDSWSFDSKIYDENVHEITEPAGTAGAAVVLGEAYIADDATTYVTPGTMYFTDDAGTTFYSVSKLGATASDVIKVEVTDTNAINELSTLYTGGTAFKNISYVPYVETLNSGFYKKTLTSWFKVEAFTTAGFATVSTAETNQTIIDALEAASDITINYIPYNKTVLVSDNSCGDATWDEAKLTVVLTKSLSSDSFWTIRTIPTTIKNWIATIASYANSTYKIQKTVDFSTDPESDIYWENLDFGDIQIFINGSIPGNWDAVRSYFTLDNGSNGNANIIASSIDTSVLKSSGCNNLFLNGITDYKVANKIASVGEKYFIHTYADIPAYASYIDAENYKKKFYASEYLAIGGRPDQATIEDEDGNESLIYVYPSVSYVHILANMLSAYQSLNFPPAGQTYGGISVENLIKCDYENFGNELKTNRINWQRAISAGTFMWEQRTNYSLNTDLSYIAPVYIVDGLREEIIALEHQFVFRYSTSTDLLNQENGLKAILDDYVSKNFLYSYELNVPSFSEAQKSGRTLKIKIGIAITKDSEVIEIELVLNRA